ncbi:hypothetical protein SAMN06298214_0790 [Bacteroidales bacterium WCE2004]|nr:hypothetical protein SAMN06298214_0790 [Bacteroidales bacterium WCE2004]
MKRKSIMLLVVAGAMALLSVSCDKPEKPVEEELLGGEGNILLETSVKNADGATGQSYVQQVQTIGGSVNMTEGIQVGFSSTLSFMGNSVFVFPAFGTDSQQVISKYEHTAKGLKPAGEIQIIPNSYPVNLSAVSATKAYIPMYNLGKVMVVNPQTMEQTGEIDLTPYAHTDNSADPASGIVVGNYYYLTLDQINSSWMPYDDYRQVDVVVIDTATDRVVKLISEKASGLCFPTRPFLPGMIFTNEQNELYVACTGYFGYNPMHLANGFAVIDTATNEFVPEKSWDISGSPIEGSEYKAASIYNCQYLGSGKAVAYVGIIELMGDNPYTARNSMAVSIDLDKRTVKKIEGVPYSDGHSVAIEYHEGVVYFSSFGVDKAGIFAYDPATGTVTQPISLNGNVNYIHFFE